MQSKPASGARHNRYALCKRPRKVARLRIMGGLCRHVVKAVEQLSQELSVG